MSHFDMNLQPNTKTFLAISLTITGETNPCAGSSPTYSAQQPSVSGSYTLEGVSWYLGTSNLGGGSFTKVIDFPPSAAGGERTIRVIATYRSGNSVLVYEGSLSISVRQILDAVPSISPDFLGIECGQTPTQTFSVNVTQITSDIAYAWNIPSGWTVLSATNGASITVQPPPFSGGVISVTVSDTKCGTSVTRNATIVRPVPPLGAISGGAGCFCAGQTQSYSVPAVNGATNYQWSASGSLFIASGQGTSSVSVGTTGSGGTLSCTASTPCGNTNTVSSNYINTASAPPPTPSVTVVTTPCANYVRTGLLSITNYDPCATYYWSATPDSHVISGAGGDLAVVAVPGFGYEAQVYGVNACGTSGIGTRTIPVDPGCFGPLRVAPLRISAAPNPFSDRTTLSYSVPEDGHVQVEVTSPTGRRIITLVNSRISAGTHEVVFDASRLPVGIYVATMTFKAKGEKHQTASVQLSVSR